MYTGGAEFTHCMVHKAPNTKSIDLKVWEEPDPDGVYVIGVDPAYGENDQNCRSAIEVIRCYADGIDQVAEYASPLVRTEQLAWVIASIMGWYGSGANSQVKYALELNGPGTAVVTEQVFDAAGREIWSRDGDGFLRYTEYDAQTGAVVKSIVDVDTSRSSSPCCSPPRPRRLRKFSPSSNVATPCGRRSRPRL